MAKNYDFNRNGFGFDAIIINHGKTLNGEKYEDRIANGMTDMEATAKSWDIDYEVAQRAKYVISVLNNEIIGIYRRTGIDFDWDRLRTGRIAYGKNRERVIFKLTDVSDEMKENYVGKTIKSFNGPIATSWK